MSEKEQPPIMDQKLCVNGCGFFGSSQTSHMCSKCWKDAMSKTMRDADANSDGAGSSTAFQPDTKPSVEEIVAAAASSTLPSKQHLQTGSDSPLQQVPPPPSPATNTPATPRSPSDETMMSVDTASDVTALPPPPIVGTNATPTPMADEEEVFALSAAALEAAETPAAPVSPMAVCEGNQTNLATTLPIGAGTMAVAGAAGVAVTGTAVAGVAAGAAASAATAAVAAASATPAFASVAVGAVVAEAVAAAAEMSTIRPVQKSRKRCFTCNKKVGYTGIACRCNYVFCSLHRYPEQHDCTFDFKSSDREDLKRTVVGGGQFSKLDRV